MAGQVLLIEDEVNIAEAIRFILSRDGHDVTWAASAAALPAELAKSKPGLVILDLMLPGKSGLEILADLKADPATAAIPVLMLTAKGQGRDRDAAEKAGAADFMTKPFANADMRDRVNKLLAGVAP